MLWLVKIQSQKVVKTFAEGCRKVDKKRFLKNAKKHFVFFLGRGILRKDGTCSHIRWPSGAFQVS